MPIKKGRRIRPTFHMGVLGRLEGGGGCRTFGIGVGGQQWGWFRIVGQPSSQINLGKLRLRICEVTASLPTTKYHRNSVVFLDLLHCNNPSRLSVYDLKWPALEKMWKPKHWRLHTSLPRTVPQWCSHHVHSILNIHTEDNLNKPT